MSENKDLQAFLNVEHNGRGELFELDSNSNVLVGTGGHCKIQLDEGNDVRSLHCILKLNSSGEIEVRDWNTGCTIINGSAISEPSILGEGDTLSIGTYRISPVIKSSKPPVVPSADDAGRVSEPEATTSVPESVDELRNSQVTENEVSTCESETSEAEIAETKESPEKTPCELSSAPQGDDSGSDEENTVEEPVSEETTQNSSSLYDDVVEETDVESATSAGHDSASKNDPDSFVYDIDADFDDASDVGSFGFSDTGFDDGGSEKSDEVQLLRMEVDQLRFELAQRDAQPKADDLLDRQQTERLVMRLEELLSELKKSDIRTRELEELLRDSDQAACDEKEERKNIEKWIGELESRVNQREEEAESELRQLRKQLAEARSLQQKTNDRLQGIIEHNAGDQSASESSEVIEQLKEQVSSLQGQLDTAHGQNDQLRKQLEERTVAAPSEEAEQISEQKMAAMQLEMSRERAEISRQRVELKKLKADLETRLEAPKEVNNADTRIRAMREHLKELHDKEQEEKSRNREAGLTGRIANLLNRVTKN